MSKSTSKPFAYPHEIMGGSKFVFTPDTDANALLWTALIMLSSLSDSLTIMAQDLAEQEESRNSPKMLSSAIYGFQISVDMVKEAVDAASNRIPKAVEVQS